MAGVSRCDQSRQSGDGDDAAVGGMPGVLCVFQFAGLGQSVASVESDDDQGAKCLYLIGHARGSDEPNALENFSASDFGEPDHNGCKVFLDAWGNPIRFLRWAPGFVSPLQPEWTAASQNDCGCPTSSTRAGLISPRRPARSALGGPGGFAETHRRVSADLLRPGRMGIMTLCRR